MRFQRTPQTLEYCYNDGTWHSVQIQRWYGIEDDSTCCPVVLTNSTNSITILNVSPTNIPTQPNVLVKSNATFVVSTDLTTLDVGNVTSQLELFEKHEVVNLSALKTTSATFGQAQLSRLVEALFEGKRNVLESALVGH